MFVFALCLLGTALALPAIPRAPILPMGSDVIISSGPEVLPYEYAMPYGIVPEFAPFKPLEFKLEEIPKEEKVEELRELKEETEELELEKKEEEPKVEEEIKTEEEPKKPVELKPEEVFIQVDVLKPHSLIGNWLSYLPFPLPASITNWFSRGERLPTRFMYPGGAGYVIVENKV